MILDIEVGEQDDSSVSGQEDQHMPESMQIREAHSGPGLAQKLVIDPAGHGQDPQQDASFGQGRHAEVGFFADVVQEQDHWWDAQGHEEKGVEGWFQEA